MKQLISSAKDKFNVPMPAGAERYIEGPLSVTFIGRVDS